MACSIFLTKSIISSMGTTDFQNKPGSGYTKDVDTLYVSWRMWIHCKSHGYTQCKACISDTGHCPVPDPFTVTNSQSCNQLSLSRNICKSCTLHHPRYHQHSMNTHSHLSSLLNQNHVHLLPSIGISTSLKGEHRIFFSVYRQTQLKPLK